MSEALKIALLGLVSWFAASGSQAAVRCSDEQRAIATAMFEEARGLDDELDRSLLLKRSLKVCEAPRAWLELGRAELGLDNFTDASYAFENGRDLITFDGDGNLGRAEAEQQALGNAWLAESYRRGGELALATVAIQEATRGFDSIGKPVPDRLIRLQAELDDALALADASVLARSFELQHERSTRGIGVRPRLRDEADPPAEVDATIELAASYSGVPASSSPAAPASSDRPESVAGANSVSESRMNIPVLFNFDSARLAPASALTVERLGAALAQLKLQSSDRVRIIGHTDAQGARTYNLALSERRATAVLERLRSLAVTSASLQAVGLGEAELRYAGTSSDDHRRNRRVELVVIR